MPADKQEHLANILRSMLRRTMERLAFAVRPQIDSLCYALREVSSLLRLFRIEHSRLVLIELPVGNSIPVKLLGELFEESGYEVEVVRVSLNRNDSAKHGIKRETLLKEKLAEFGVQSNDLVVYIDEWFTGSNFYRICRILQKQIRKHKALLIPIGLLGHDATSDYRYAERFKSAHDSICDLLGVEEGHLRFKIPKIKAKFISPGFFWSEHDRTVGYRKMQFLGSFFSSLDATIEKLKQSPADYLRGKMALLTHASMLAADDPKKQAMLRKGARKNGPLDMLFEESYEDYCECRIDLQTLKHESNLGEAENPVEAMDEVAREVYRIIENRKAKLCVDMAIFYMHESPEIDQHNRYYVPRTCTSSV